MIKDSNEPFLEQLQKKGCKEEKEIICHDEQGKDFSKTLAWRCKHIFFILISYGSIGERSSLFIEFAPLWRIRIEKAFSRKPLMLKYIRVNF